MHCCGGLCIALYIGWSLFIISVAMCLLYYLGIEYNVGLDVVKYMYTSGCIHIFNI